MDKQDENNMNLRPPDINAEESNQIVTDYRCEQCGKYFSAARSLLLHEKIHTGKRPYKCPEENCGKEFYVRAMLVRHAHVHSQVREEVCTFKNCTSPIKKFKTKADVRQHIRNWHTIEKYEQREIKLLKKLEKFNVMAQNLKKTKALCKHLTEENRLLRQHQDITHFNSDLTYYPSIQTMNSQDISSMFHFKKDKSRGSTSLKKPVPPYTRYATEHFKQLKQNNPVLSFTECSKRLSTSWRQLSDVEKQKYVDDYKIEMEEWQKKKEQEFLKESTTMVDTHYSLDNAFNNNKQIVPSYTYICSVCGNNNMNRMIKVPNPHTNQTNYYSSDTCLPSSSLLPVLSPSSPTTSTLQPPAMTHSLSLSSPSYNSISINTDLSIHASLSPPVSSLNPPSINSMNNQSMESLLQLNATLPNSVARVVLPSHPEK
ncbi:hypothetical protein WA158_007982 [Blastocystis sp. Blastoise]